VILLLFGIESRGNEEFTTDTKYTAYPFYTYLYPVDYFSIDVMILVFTTKTQREKSLTTDQARIKSE